jgi:ketosteroid isomerase-like protein
MKKLLIIIMFLSLFISSCSENEKDDQVKKWKQEIENTELEFADMASKEGLQKAFLSYAADDAVLNRNNTILKGKEAIKDYFENQTLSDVKLVWVPDFIEVSRSGDLGYTYGKFNFSAIDTTGNKIEAQGIFHSVWKRQADGNWRFVWD